MRTKVMSVDYGKRRIGFAVTDPEGICIRGLDTAVVRGRTEAIETICTIAEREKPQIVVFGLPLDMHGKDTSMSLHIREIATNVAQRLPSRVDYIDESFSSRDAHTLLRTKKKKIRQTKARTDRIAACLILEHYQKDHACMDEW
jgi:putative Holliday junction resolvase